MSLFGLLEGYSSVSIIGMCKNAGKTTVLNHLLAEAMPRPEVLGLTSIGRDGEDSDLATGTKKPGIWVREGTLLATAAGLLPYCDITREILAATGIPTPLGEVVVLRALSDGAAQIAGPSIVAQLGEVSALFRAFGARRIFIDGAISRKSLCSRSISEATVLCAGASCGHSPAEVARAAAHFAELALLPEAKDPRLGPAAALPGAKLVLLGREMLPLPQADLAAALREHPGNQNEYLLATGALTDAMLKPLITSGLNISGLALVARDASRLLLTHGSYQKLQAKKAALRVLESVNLTAVAINPFSAYGNHFSAGELGQKIAERVPLPVFDVEGGTRWN